MERKKNHAIPNATTLAIGMSQNTNGILFIDGIVYLVKKIDYQLIYFANIGYFSDIAKEKRRKNLFLKEKFGS